MNKVGKILLASLTIFALTLQLRAEGRHGFVGDTSDYSPLVYDSLWKSLKDEFGDGIPDQIEIKKYDFSDGRSRFRSDTSPMSVWINPKTFSTGTAPSIIVHESSHIANWRLASQGSGKYSASYFNEFRFIDEGFANIVGDRAAGREDRYLRHVGAALFRAKKAGHLSLKEMENWRNRASSPEQPGRFDPNLPSYFDYDYAYETGSSFLYYLDSLTQKSRIVTLIKDFGLTLDLAKSLANVYGDFLSSNPTTARQKAEVGWLAFADNIAFEPQEPNISSRFPSNHSNEVACDRLQEIYVTFDQPMNTSVIALDTTNSSRYGISYKNATWVSDTKLKVAVQKEMLVPDKLITLTLGYNGSQGHFPLKSDLGAPLKILPWSFLCKAGS